MMSYTLQAKFHNSLLPSVSSSVNQVPSGTCRLVNSYDLVRGSNVEWNGECCQMSKAIKHVSNDRVHESLYSPSLHRNRNPVPDIIWPPFSHISLLGSIITC